MFINPIKMDFVFPVFPECHFSLQFSVLTDLKKNEVGVKEKSGIKCFCHLQEC